MNELELVAAPPTALEFVRHVLGNVFGQRHSEQELMAVAAKVEKSLPPSTPKQGEGE